MPVITPAQHSLIVFKAILVANSIKLLKQQPLDKGQYSLKCESLNILYIDFLKFE